VIRAIHKAPMVPHLPDAKTNAASFETSQRVGDEQRASPFPDGWTSVSLDAAGAGTYRLAHRLGRQPTGVVANVPTAIAVGAQMVVAGRDERYGTIVVSGGAITCTLWVF
jgi:hypothetical protein